MMRTAEVYRYEVPAGSDELVGELLTDVVTDSMVASVDPTDKDQTKELASIIDEYGALKEVAVEPLELARMVVASRVNGWVPSGESLHADWQKAHAGYTELNGEAPVPATFLNVDETGLFRDQPYGYYMSGMRSDALMLDHIKISPSRFFEPTLQSYYEGYGKLFLGHGRVVPNVQIRGLQKQQILPMLLHSAATEQPVTSEEHDTWSGNHKATLHYALGSRAVLALPDYLHQTGRFTDEILLEELGKLGVPLRHSELYQGHQFSDAEREEQTEDLRQRMLASLLVAGGIMTDEVRSRVALHDIDPVALTGRLERDFSVVEAIAPFIRRNNSKNYRSSNGTYKPPVKEIKGVSVELEAWEREAEGFDKELVEHALGVNAPF